MTPKSFALVGLLVAACLTPDLCRSQPVTIERLLSSPFPSSLKAAPAGGLIAWVQNAQGVRNIWVAGPPDYQPHQLTTYSEDDGQDLGGLTWTPDARRIVFERGGSENRQGENPNPTSNPSGSEQALWCVTADSGKTTRIGTGNSPAISPRGDRVVFLRRGNVYQAPLDSAGEPVQLFRARGETGSLRWSPDGMMLAFVSARTDHAFIGIYDFRSKSIRFIDPSVDRDNNPVWSPDGKRIAFIRFTASIEPRLFRPQRTAPPWAILIADAASGRLVDHFWKADPGPGSAFHGVSAENQLIWTADNLIIFPWERTGWTLLYARPAGGGKTTLLTPGEFEVEHVTLAADRRTIFFDSNQGDIDRRHLWRIDPGASSPVQITRGTGIEWSPAPAHDGSVVAFLRSDARVPARPAILERSGRIRDLLPMPPDFPSGELVEPLPVKISAADGLEVPGQLFLPRSSKRGEKHPAVIFFHGGSRRQMLLGWHYSGYYSNAYALNQYLAGRGFVVLSLNYRSGTGYGLEFREALDYGASGASEFNDVLGAGLYLRSREDVDPGRIGLWGGSYGGYLTALGLAKASDLFAAGVDIHGVHEWNTGVQTFNPSYDPRRYEEAARIARMSSPITYVDGWRSPVLVIHGDDDRNVAFSQTVSLVEKLRQRNVEVEQIVFPDEVHSFLLHRHWLQALEATAEFFERRIGRR